MNEAFDSYISLGTRIAESNHLDWDFIVTESGKVQGPWNLTKIINASPPNVLLNHMGFDRTILGAFNKKLQDDGMQARPMASLSINWQELVKAAVCDYLFLKRCSPSYIMQFIVRAIQSVAVIAEEKQPWDLTHEDINKAASLAHEIQPSKVLGNAIISLSRTLLDANHLCDGGQIFPLLTLNQVHKKNTRVTKFYASKESLLSNLEERKNSEKLPEKKAFWELVRIIFTEQPRTFVDQLRFSSLQAMIFTGLRIGEISQIPHDWKRYQDHFDRDGQPAGESGGISRSLFLRHFAEKQYTGKTINSILFESMQSVPQIFEELLCDSMGRCEELTAPLRKTLQLQMESNRVFPWYKDDDLIPASEIYTRISGNPIWLNLDGRDLQHFMNKYKERFDPEILNDLATFQLNLYNSRQQGVKATMPMYMFFRRIQDSPFCPTLVNSDREFLDVNSVWKSANDTFVSASDIESFLANNLPSKQSDKFTFKTSDGEISSWEFMLLFPKRSLAEERNEGITDILRCTSIGSANQNFLSTNLLEDYNSNIFKKYSNTDDDKNLTLNSHSLRHLQNTELFRQGIADTIITKRFNRKSIAQSYEYDHRSLSEHLDRIDIPIDFEIDLGPKAASVAKMIQAGIASGPIVDTFKKIQKTSGDEEAFQFLKVEADGFHSTPYGHCINSFTVEPCPKHLECFAGCNHLTATNFPEHRRNLELLEKNILEAVDSAQKRGAVSIGFENQIKHAMVRLEGVRKLLATEPGKHVFPDGVDLSASKVRKSVLDE